MSYFLKKSSTRKKGVYLQIYQSFYVPGKGGRNKSYRALGYVNDLIKSGINDPVAHFQKEVDELNHISAPQIGDVSVSKNAGYFIVKSMFDYLDMDRVMNIMSSNFKTEYKMSDFVRTLTYVQFVEPGSKLHAFENVIPNLYDCHSFSYNQILDGIEFIGSDYSKFIELINHSIAEKWKRNLSTAFFDCTNYYFEIYEQDDYRRFGPSKENRHCPLIGQALMLDADMIPLDTVFFPGNQSEKPFLRNCIEDMKEKNNVTGRVIQVADKGLNCARNIYAAVVEAKDGYIFSKSVHGKNLSDSEKEWVLLKEENKTNKWEDVRNHKGELLYRYKVSMSENKNGEIVPYDTFEYSCKINETDTEKTYFSVKEKRIITYNPTLAKKQKREILKEVDNLKKTMSYKEILKSELGDSAKYVNFEASTKDGKKVKIATSLKQDKIDEDLKLAGYNLLVTSEIDADPIQIYKTYHQLWRIEESFRIMKTYLESRPVFVQKEYSIYGHFLICYYALVMERLIELKIFNDEFSPHSIFEFIRNYKVTITSDGSFINCATDSALLKAVKSKFGLSKLANLYLTKHELDNIINAEL